MLIFRKNQRDNPKKYIPLIINKLKFFNMSKIKTKNPVLQRNGVKNSHTLIYNNL
jgi:hypothetical protein